MSLSERQRPRTISQQPRSIICLVAYNPRQVTIPMTPEPPLGDGADDLSGRRLGPFQVHERIGAGGMGEVYRARDTRLARDVAIKILHRSVTGDPQRLARF